MHIPRDIAIIFTKPGVEWMCEEKERINRWLCEQNTLHYLVRFALKHLGHPATPEDAVEVLGDFYEKRLSRVMESYDPAKGKENFWNYLRVPCFENFCHDERPKIVRRREHEVPPLKPEDDEGESVAYEEVGEIGEDLDPEKRIVIEDEHRVAREFVKECLRRLKPKYREVVEMQYIIRDMSHEEIAEELGISIGYARLKHHRALQEFRKWMTKYLPRLKPKYREVVEMQQRHMSHEEIAEELGISETSAKVRLANAWRELLDCLREEGFA